MEMLANEFNSSWPSVVLPAKVVIVELVVRASSHVPAMTENLVISHSV